MFLGLRLISVRLYILEGGRKRPFEGEDPVAPKKIATDMQVESELCITKNSEKDITVHTGVNTGVGQRVLVLPLLKQPCPEEHNILPYQGQRELCCASRQGIHVLSWQNNSLLDNTVIPSTTD